MMKSFYNRLDPMELELIGQIEKIQIIDAHEHLPSEKVRLDSNVDALTLFSHYCRGDLEAAGMGLNDVNYVFSDAPIDERWEKFKPYYPHIRDTAYSRAAHIAMERFYGESELNDDTVYKVTESIKAANKEGLYKRILRDACNIKTCLNQNSDRSDDGLLTPVYWTLGNPRSCVEISAHSSVINREILSLDDLLEAGRKYVDDIKSRGGVGYKFFVNPMRKPDISVAKDAFSSLMSGKTDILPLKNPLTDIYFDTVLTRLGELGLTACVHTGYWRDYRELDPSHAIYMLDNYKNVSFDIYHLGYPYVRDAIMLGKSRSNVWLNMCWTYIISEKFAYEGLSELFDMVPTNKIIGFGGDYFIVEKVFGHLMIARQTISRVLCARIREGLLTFDRAVDLADKILRVNPSKLYKL